MCEHGLGTCTCNVLTQPGLHMALRLNLSSTSGMLISSGPPIPPHAEASCPSCWSRSGRMRAEQLELLEFGISLSTYLTHHSSALLATRHDAQAAQMSRPRLDQ